jgi:hypothetical protein
VTRRDKYILDALDKAHAISVQIGARVHGSHDSSRRSWRLKYETDDSMGWLFSTSDMHEYIAITSQVLAIFKEGRCKIRQHQPLCLKQRGKSPTGSLRDTSQSDSPETHAA